MMHYMEIVDLITVTSAGVDPKSRFLQEILGCVSMFPDR